MSRHRGCQNLPVDVELLGEISLLSPGVLFYPLSDWPFPFRNHRGPLKTEFGSGRVCLLSEQGGFYFYNSSQRGVSKPGVGPNLFGKPSGNPLRRGDTRPVENYPAKVWPPGGVNQGGLPHKWGERGDPTRGAPQGWGPGGFKSPQIFWGGPPRGDTHTFCKETQGVSHTRGEEVTPHKKRGGEAPL